MFLALPALKSQQRKAASTTVSGLGKCFGDQPIFMEIRLLLLVYFFFFFGPDLSDSSITFPFS